jgi:hypothetical protein
MSTMPENPALIFPNLTRGLAMAALTNRGEAIRYLNEIGAVRSARILQKAPVPATSTGDSDIAVMYGAWSASMAKPSVFYKLLAAGFRKFPMYKKMGFFTALPTATVNLEGHAAPVSRAVVAHTSLQPWTIATQIVVTQEMLFDPGSESAFNQELKLATAQRVDGALTQMLFDDSGALTIPSSGPTPDNAVADIRAAMLALGAVGDASRVVWLMASDVARKACALGSEGGGTFPSMTPGGGQIRGVNALVSAGIPAGQALLFDAAQIGAADAGTVARTSSEADIEMSDAPASDAGIPTGTTMVSMFQSNSVAMATTATIAAAKLHDFSAVLLENIDWGAGA